MRPLLILVAEKTPHRHHPGGGVQGLSEYVARAIAEWPRHLVKDQLFPLAVATKATILGHTLRGASPTPVDKTMGQQLAYEAIRRLVEQPETAVGCYLAWNPSGRVEAVPLHSLAPRPFDWELFARMHGSLRTELPSGG